MYEEYFGLNSSAFDLSPDPSFLFSSEKNQETLASISYAVSRRKGFVVMTGEVGTGKTLMLRCLFKLWESEQLPFAYFIGPKLSTMDFLKYITVELGIEVAEPTKGNLLRALYGFFLTQFEKDLTTVLIIDEAHQLPQNVLEEVRLLANFETAQQKLVQILLVGQPELDNKLDSIELRSLKQRIAVRCHLEPLRGEEIRRYIERRLELAGAGPQTATIFPLETVKAISRYSRGIPRLINSICDQSLIVAYARQLRVVPVEIIEDVATRFRLDAAPDITQPEKLSSHKRRTENPALDRTLNLISDTAVTTITTTGSDAIIKGSEVAIRKPAKTTPPEGQEVSPEPEFHQETAGRNPIDQSLPPPDIRSLNREAKTVRWPLDQTAHLKGTVSATVQSKACVPVISQPASPVGNLDAIFRSILTVGRVRLFELYRRLTPALRLSFLISAAAVIAVALPAGVLIVRHQIGPVTATQQVPDTGQTFPARSATASVQPAGTDSTLRVDPIMHPTNGGSSQSTRQIEERLTPGKKLIKATLARPTVKLPDLSTPIEPPLIIGMQPAESGGGLPNIFAASPMRPSAIGGHLQPAKLESSPAPVYPTRARVAKVEGTVVIDALVDETGKVTDTKVISGPALLTQAAIEALRTWKYEPERLNGQAVASHMNVSIKFSLR